MKRPVHSLILALLTASAMIATPSAHAEVIDIEASELQKMLAAGVAIVDIRTAPEWLQTGVVPESRLLTFFDEKGKVDAAAWLAQVQKFAKPSDPVILICRTGNRTKEASRFLSANAGYAKVYNVKYGIKDWIASNRPIVSAAPILSSCKAADTC
jgi:rhodanese-related sulfurtransferase